LTALRLAVEPARTAEPGIEMSALVTMVLHFAWYAGLVVVLRQLERRWPAGEQTTRQEQLYNFGLAVIAALTTTLLLDLGSVSGYLRRWIGIEAALVPGWAPRGWVEWILGSLLYLVIWDLLQYWYHRLQHVVPQLWPMHALHHDSEALNASDALRNTLWHHIATTFLVTLPIVAIAGHSVLHPYAAWVFLQGWGFYIHANLRWSHGPLTAVIAGPQWHRLHHARAPQYYNCNFAALFPVIDIVFGTYRAPAPGEFPETGLSDRGQSAGGVREILWALLGRAGKGRAADER